MRRVMLLAGIPDAVRVAAAAHALDHARLQGHAVARDAEHVVELCPKVAEPGRRPMNDSGMVHGREGSTVVLGPVHVNGVDLSVRIEGATTEAVGLAILRDLILDHARWS